MAQIIVMCILKFLFIYNRYTGTGNTLIERKVMVNYLIGFDNLKQCRERYDDQIQVIKHVETIKTPTF